ncbi:MAG TPA: hypothetical protein PKL84_08220, partial [Candidatus Hydrogenedentes bacterium]|nr:hypothetical protein [Candidatus Hydrogenedentota bacterium]
VEVCVGDLGAPGYRKYDMRTSRGLAAYAAVHLTIILVFAVGFIGAEGSMAVGERILAALLIFATVLCLGGIFEARWWTPYLEAARLAALGAALLMYGGELFGWPAYRGLPAAAVTLTAVACSLVVLFAQRARFVSARQ